MDERHEGGRSGRDGFEPRSLSKNKSNMTGDLSRDPKALGLRSQGFVRSIVMEAWNDWLHVSGSTYGTWLRGDPRGWRSRRHREHCEGDYKNPPPKGEFDEEFERSKELLDGE